MAAARPASRTARPGAVGRFAEAVAGEGPGPGMASQVGECGPPGGEGAAGWVMSPPRSGGGRARRGGGRAPAPLIDSGARPAAHKGGGAGRGAAEGLATAAAGHRAPLPTGLAPPEPQRAVGSPPAPCQVRREGAVSRREAPTPGRGVCGWVCGGVPLLSPPGRSSPWGAPRCRPLRWGLGVARGRRGRVLPRGRLGARHLPAAQPRPPCGRAGAVRARGSGGFCEVKVGLQAFAGNWL